MSSITFDDIIAVSSTFKDTVSRAKRYAKTHGTILLTGPTGTGKSYIAQAIHNASPRSNYKFVNINCANLSPTLLESELFGHEKGAFTGAVARKMGQFEMAHNGTIFLDEIGEMSVELQARLLRVLEDGKFERVGGCATITTNVRLISATNQNLPRLIRCRKFREDLFYRINMLQLEMLPLAKRKACIPVLADSILKTSIKRHNREDIKGFSLDAQIAIDKYHWPGNIRQLKNVVEQSCILEDGEYITPESLNITNVKGDIIIGAGVIKHAVEVEKNLLVDALELTGYNQKVAAELLGISARSINYRIKKFGIVHPTWIVNK